MNAINLSAERENPEIGIPGRCRDPAWPGAHEQAPSVFSGWKTEVWESSLGLRVCAMILDKFLPFFFFNV